MVDSTRHLEVGRRALSLGDSVAAEAAFRAAIEAAEKAAPESEELAVALATLAQMDAASGRLDEAAEGLRRSLAIRERVLGVDHAGLISVLQQLGILAVNHGDLSAAEAYLGRALGIAELRLGASHPELATTLNDLAQLHLRRAAYTLAEPLLRRLLEIRSAGGEERPEVATVMASLAAVHHALAEHDAAERLRRRVLEIRERTLAPEHFAVATSLEQLAETCAARGKLDEALGQLKRALAIRLRSLEPGHPSIETVRAKITDVEMQRAQDGEFTIFTPALPQFGETRQLPSSTTSPHQALPHPPAAQVSSVQEPSATPIAARSVGAQETAQLAALRPAAAEMNGTAVLARREMPQTPLSLSFLESGGAIVVPSSDTDVAFADDDEDELERPDHAFTTPLQKLLSRRSAMIVAGVVLLAGASGVVLRAGTAESASDFSATTLASREPGAANAAALLPVPMASANDSAPAASTTADVSPRGAAAERDLPSSSRESRPAASAPAPTAAARQAPTEPPPITVDGSTRQALAAASSRAEALVRGLGFSAPELDSRDASAGAASALARGRAVSATSMEVRNATLQGEVPRPDYPSSLHRAGAAGEVIFSFVVDTAGRVDMSSVRVLRTSSERLIDPVRAVLPQLRFSPAVLGDRKIPQTVEMPFRFTPRP